MNAVTQHQTTSSIAETFFACEGARLKTAQPQTVSTDWRRLLPLLGGQTITLRQLEMSDAPTLHEMLSTEEVSRFISPPPTTVEGYERFIAWTHRQREAGVLVCFAIVPKGTNAAVGIIQVRSLEKGFGTAEWGFALGSPFWGTGVFMEAAALVLEFSFDEVGVHRMEARCSVHNGRGARVLEKLGAVCEARLRQSFLKDGVYHDQYLAVISEADWRLS